MSPGAGCFKGRLTLTLALILTNCFNELCISTMLLQAKSLVIIKLQSLMPTSFLKKYFQCNKQLLENFH